MGALRMNEALGLGGLFLSAFVSATLAPGGSEAVLAYLVAQGEFPLGGLLAVATFGNVLGAMTTWALGALAARDRNTGGAIRHARAIERARRVGVPLLLLSWLPVIGDGFCFAAGWLRLPLGAGIAAITVGKLARYAVVVALAHGGASLLSPG